MNFASGASAATASNAAALQLAHGLLMFAAWGLLLPVGAAVARFGKPRAGAPSCLPSCRPAAILPHPIPLSGQPHPPSACLPGTAVSLAARRRRLWPVWSGTA